MLTTEVFLNNVEKCSCFIFSLLFREVTRSYIHNVLHGLHIPKIVCNHF